MKKKSKKSNWLLVYLIFGTCVVSMLAVIFMAGFNEASVRLNIRWSARFSIVCFCLAFMASSFHSFFKNSFSTFLLSNRKYLGVSFAIIHLIHLALLFVLHYEFDPIFVTRPIVELVLGGLAYLFLVLMFLTSFNRISQLISKANWNRLHTLGGYWILIVYSNSILGRVVNGQIGYLPLGILVLSVWLLRILTWSRR